jgi:type IV pilus assembly protein PilB
VTQLISNALKERASDIHVEPFEKRVRIRYRIDGVCVEKENPPKKLQGPIISRIKIMSRMDMAEKRRTQDGRIKIQLHGREIDLRVSALPARHGESVVMRILDKEKGLVDLEELGFHESDYNRFNRIIKRPNGIFLVTGPTGSGKTTTLYAALKKLNRPDVKIITAENPIEYNLAGINQSEVRHDIGLTFQRILRAMMRQAPNIILVGEIRDGETADIAIQAALTGHLVFSTLHTNDAPSAITRLIDMGVKPFLVASAVMAILAQRLVRILCPECKEPYEPTDVELRSVGLTRARLEGHNVYRPAGCPACSGVGFKGRKGVYELMEMSPDLREMAFQRKPSNQIRAKARSEGMVNLLDDGVRKILAGLTTIQEVLGLAHRAD